MKDTNRVANAYLKEVMKLKRTGETGWKKMVAVKGGGVKELHGSRKQRKTPLFFLLAKVRQT